MAPPQTWLTSHKADNDDDDDEHKCMLDIETSDGQKAYYDVQKAKLNDWVVPGIVEMETYRPDCLITSGWIYMKGDLHKGPLPGHPYKQPDPFRNTTWSFDLVGGSSGGKGVFRNIMPPANVSTFVDSMLPGARWDNYSMVIAEFDRSCKYYEGMGMIFRWTTPSDLDESGVFRLRLTTDNPPSTHWSGAFRLWGNETCKFPPLDLSASFGMLDGYGQLGGWGMYPVFVVGLLAFGVWRFVTQIWWRPRRVQLE